MKRQSKKYKHTLKLLKFFLFVQVSTFIVAATIVTIILIPNDFKAKHTSYQDCLDENKSLTDAELSAACPEPYQN